MQFEDTNKDKIMRTGEGFDAFTIVKSPEVRVLIRITPTMNRFPRKRSHITWWFSRDISWPGADDVPVLFAEGP